MRAVRRVVVQHLPPNTVSICISFSGTSGTFQVRFGLWTVQPMKHRSRGSPAHSRSSLAQTPVDTVVGRCSPRASWAQAWPPATQEPSYSPPPRAPGPAGSSPDVLGRNSIPQTETRLFRNALGTQSDLLVYISGVVFPPLWENPSLAPSALSLARERLSRERESVCTQVCSPRCVVEPRAANRRRITSEGHASSGRHHFPRLDRVP